MIKEVLYLLIVILGIPAGLLLKRICREEVKAWKTRLKIISIAAAIIAFVLLFVNFQYKIPAIVTLVFMIVTCITIVLKK